VFTPASDDKKHYAEGDENGADGNQEPRRALDGHLAMHGVCQLLRLDVRRLAISETTTKLCETRTTSSEILAQDTRHPKAMRTAGSQLNRDRVSNCTPTSAIAHRSRIPELWKRTEAIE
jgi:hypothetical protein